MKFVIVFNKIIDKMVCPVCILPLVGGLGATGSGVASTKTNSSYLKYGLIALTVLLIVGSLYFYIYKEYYKDECDVCKIN